MSAISLRLTALAAVLLATLTVASFAPAFAQEVAQEGLAAPTVDTSLIGLFLEAGLVVKI